MMLPGLTGWLLLAYLLVILPWLAARTATKLQAMQAAAKAPGAVAPDRIRVYAGSLYMLVILYLLAWMAGGGNTRDFFWYPALGQREVWAGIAVLVLHFVLRYVNRRIHSEAERGKMAIDALLPRNRTEWAFFLVIAAVAGIAEETAYRGVGMFILTDLLGNPWIAAPILAVAFGLAHRVQGWKSVGVIVVMALLMHALVQFTGALVVAMAVHALYDIGAGLWGVFATQQRSAPKGRKTVL